MTIAERGVLAGAIAGVAFLAAWNFIVWWGYNGGLSVVVAAVAAGLWTAAYVVAVLRSGRRP